MLDELRPIKGLIEERFGALAFMEKLQRQPGAGAPDAEAARLRLLAGADPQARRRPAGRRRRRDRPGRPACSSATCCTAESSAALEDRGGVYALIGPTGVGKTTTTAKIAAAFATKYGAANLGLITLDAYRVGAHEQLRAYGRILGVPVHTAHDRASLEDLLDLLTAKKMVLIDTAGMAQRDSAHARAARHAVAPLDPASCWSSTPRPRARRSRTCWSPIAPRPAPASFCRKLDEAVKLGPALDAADPPQAQGRRRRQRPARARRLASPVGARAGARARCAAAAAAPTGSTPATST